MLFSGFLNARRANYIFYVKWPATAALFRGFILSLAEKENCLLYCEYEV
jgi:hypothetical protein